MRSERRTRWALLRWIVAMLVSGCGAHIGTGWQARSRAPDVSGPPHVIMVGVRGYNPRQVGPFVGTDAVAADWAYDGDVELRQVITTGGLRVPLGRVATELGGDLGLGSPALAPMDGLSVYLGVSNTWLLRLSGQHDQNPGFALAGMLVDLFALGRIGVWGRTPGEQGPALGDAAIVLGVRASAISDIVLSADEDWEP